MRLATFVLGIAFVMTGETTLASEPLPISTFKVAHAASMGEGVFAPRADRAMPEGAARRGIEETNMHTGAIGAMGLLPAQSPASFAHSVPFDGSNSDSPRRYHPANIPLPATRTVEDHLLTGFVALMLIAYQLRRKHRFLRPHQFST